MNTGLAMHCHHDTLFEYVFDYNERITYIKRWKPKREQELRLRLFKLVPNKLLPGRGSRIWEAYIKAEDASDKARDAYIKAEEACDKAWEACDKAWEVYVKAWEVYVKAWEACVKAWGAYDKAKEAYDKAEEAYDKAKEAYLLRYKEELLALHRELCPDCPWSGETIFTRQKENGEWY